MPFSLGGDRGEVFGCERGDDIGVALAEPVGARGAGVADLERERDRVGIELELIRAENLHLGSLTGPGPSPTTLGDDATLSAAACRADQGVPLPRA